MNIKNCIILCFCFTISFAQAQVVFEETFESGSLDPNWEIETMATDEGWNVGTPSQLSTGAFSIADNGSTYVIGTNDDKCNCDKNNEKLITPAIDLAGLSIAALSFDLHYGDSFYQGDQEKASVNISTDKVNWTKLKDLYATTGWEKQFVDLSEYVGQTIYLSFNYSDGGGWLYGCVLDNIKVYLPLNIDGALLSAKGLLYGEMGTPYKIPLKMYNQGVANINQLDISYTINGGTPQNQIFDNLSVYAFESFELDFTQPWVPNVLDINTVEVNINSVNGDLDEDLTNNVYQFEVEIFEKVVRPNIIDEISASNPRISPIADFQQNLDGPTDLEFFPIMGKSELWIVNEETADEGGSTVIVSDATVSPSGFEFQTDGNAWHFMSLPTALAFSSDNYNFATSPGIQDANHSGGSFTGPTLWSSDPLIYAKPSGGNGSHLDMLHGSPFSMGIAHEVDNVFWVYDGSNKDIVRYDFVDDHGPGNDYHGDALVRRYKDIGIQRFNDIPNHMILDKETGWLYFVDTGNSRVMRLDINSGNFGGDLPLINEPLEEHSEIVNFTYEEIISEGVNRPCGIEIIENRLLVSDYSSGDIIIYDMDDDFNELDRIMTDSPGITGLTVGPDGNVWYTNKNENTLMKVEVGDMVSVDDIDDDLGIDIFPNPSNGKVFIRNNAEGNSNEYRLTLINLAGKNIYMENRAVLNSEMDFSYLEAGIYFLNITNGLNSQTEKLVIE